MSVVVVCKLVQQKEKNFASNRPTPEWHSRETARREANYNTSLGGS